jgi:serine/threonine-protein kinase
MTPERWRQVTGVFHAALSRDTASRPAFLDQACAGDRALRDEVDAMLAAHADAGRFGESPIGASAAGDDVLVRLQSGATLGPYRIDSLIGAGGMGQVYRARDARIGRDVAIKVLPAEYAADRDRLRRFEQEVRASGALNHPNILTLYDVGTLNAQPYLVMELLDGETLRDRIRRGPLPPARAGEIAADIARGLSAAHAKGIIHRDLKPENVMITRDRRVKILDFGIAKLKNEDVTADGRTLTSPLKTAPETVVGTAGYMAPEQVRGLLVDERADLFALGAILFEMLTGRRAFDRPSRIETMHAILNDEPPPLTTITPLPIGIERIVRRCLEKDRDARFHSAGDLAFALETTTATNAVTSDTPGGGVAPVRDRRTNLTRAAAAVALVAVAIAAWALWRSRPVANAGVLRRMARFAIPPPPGMAYVGYPIISPDGSLLVFVVDQGADTRGPVRRLYLRRLDQLEAVAIPGTEGARAPFFSPDGQSVGFVADGKIKTIGITVSGASPVSVIDVAGLVMGATWTPDNTIVFGSIEHGLQRVPAGGGAPQPLTTPDRERSEIDHHWPRMLPGGKALLFTSHHGTERYDVVVQVLATGERKVLVESAFAADYSPTGHIVYGSGRNLFAVPFDAERIEVTGAPVKLLDDVLTGLTDGSAAYSLSAVGTIVYRPAPSRAGRHLVWMDRSGTSTPITRSPQVFANPRLSPDGQRVAVTVSDGGLQHIWVYRLANGTGAPVTFEGVNSAPLWTPDSQRLTYTSLRNGSQHLFWQRIDGSAPAESLIASASNNIAAAGWSPDGRVLIYTEDPPTSNTQIRALINSGERRSEPVAGIPLRSQWPALSPDGRWLAFVTSAEVRPDIHLQPFPGPGLRRQIVEGGGEPVWSRDGRELFYRSRRGAAGVADGRALSDEGIFAVPFDRTKGEATSEPRLLFRGKFAANSWAMPPMFDVTPDGQRFVIVTAGPEEFIPVNLNVLMNFGDELLRRVPGGR